MDQPGDADAEDVQRDHGRGENAHVQDVGGRGDDGRDDEDHQNRVAQVAPHPSGGDDAHQRQEENQDGQFKNYAHADHDGQKQVRVFADCDHRLELFAVVDQEVEGLRDRPSCRRNNRRTGTAARSRT